MDSKIDISKHFIYVARKEPQESQIIRDIEEGVFYD